MAYQVQRSRRSVTIDVTPLVNVALILLIVFMVVTPMIREGVQVNLPEAEHGESSSDASENRVTVAVQPGGEIFVDLKPVTEATLEQELARAYRGREGRTIVIRGDRTLDYGRILAVMNACRRIGAPEVSLVTKKDGGS